MGSKHTQLNKSGDGERDQGMKWKEEMLQSCSRDAAATPVEIKGGKVVLFSAVSSTYFSARDPLLSHCIFSQLEPFNSCVKAVTLNG